MDSFLYSLITDNKHNTQTTEQMDSEVMLVMGFLVEQASMLGLEGAIRDIHVSVLQSQLDLYDEDDLRAYMSVVYGQEYTGREGVIDVKYGYLERMRYHTYVQEVLFAGSRAPYEGVMNYHEVPTPEEILSNGAEYYYKRVGSLTVEYLMNTYDKFEMLVMIGSTMAAMGRQLVADDGSTLSQIALTLLHSLSQLRVDPRAYMGSTIPIKAYKPAYNIGFIYSGLTEDASYEGIPVANRRDEDVYDDVVMQQLSPTFYREKDSWRPFLESVRNDKTTNGLFVADVVNPLLYASNTGSVAMGNRAWVFDERELADLFRARRMFINPHTGVPFSLASVVKLTHLAVDSSLIKVIRELMGSGMAPTWALNPPLRWTVTKRELLTMWNIGVNWVEWDSQMLSVTPYDLYAKRTDIIEPQWTDRFRLTLKGQVGEIAGIKDGDRMFMATVSLQDLRVEESDTTVGENTHISTGSITDSVAALAVVLNRAIDLGLWQYLRHQGQRLMATASYYMLRVHNQRIGGTNIRFTSGPIKLEA